MVFDAAQAKRIQEAFADDEKVLKAIEDAVRDALLKHKRLGNTVCGWKDGRIVILQPEEILVDDGTE